MTLKEFDKCLVAYNEKGNDYRFVLSREQIKDIKEALDQESLVEEIRKLIEIEENDPK